MLTAFPYDDNGMRMRMVNSRKASISRRFHFHDFRLEERGRKDDIRLLGSANVDSETGTITIPAHPDADVDADVAGRALYSSPVRMLNPDTMSSASFETTFAARLTGGAGGGLAFLVVPDELTVGRAGAWLGMMNDGCDEGYRHLAVEFDTYKNREFGDPNDNHVGINLASIVSNWTADASAANVSLGDGSMLRSWIGYDSNLTRIEIRVAREGEAKPAEPLLSVFTDLAPLMNEYMFVGFSASGSKLTQVHSWNFSSSLLSRLRFPDEDTCETRFISSPPKANKRPHPHAFIIFILVALGLLVVFVNLACIPWRRIRDFSNLKKLKLILTMKKLKKKKSSRKLILRRRPSPFLHRPRRFALAEILEAHKDSILDSTFFAASLSDGTQVAVKRFSLEDCPNLQKVMKEIGYLSRLHHPNLVPLRGWCKDIKDESSEVFLVYEYMANGSLHDWLHGDAVLPWVRRHKIVREVANALAYMHMGAHKMLLHKDVSTKNVLLDAAFRARLGDFFAVLGLDFFKIITEVHPSLDDSGGQSKSISNHTIERLDRAVQSLRQEKNARIQKLQDLGGSLMDLWNLMDTPAEERQLFQHITCVIVADEDQVVAPRALALDNIEQAEVEVERLDQLKASKMKELVTKKHGELEEIYRRGHMELNPATALDKFIAIIDSGMFDPSELLASIDGLIAEAQEEALSRKDIMDKMDKWMAACEEERWLDDYNRDDNRYNASRGAHINLKRAEKARITVNKIPAMVDTLVAKTKAWEEERAVLFLYDGIRLLDMLEEYALLRQEREEEKRQLRDQKRMQELMITEQETLFGTRPSPNKAAPSAKKGSGAATMAGNRRLSLQQNTGAEPTAARGANGLTPVRVVPATKDSKREKGVSRQSSITPSNYVALPKDDCPAAAFTASLSPSSVNGSEPPSPASCNKNGAVAVGSYA